MYIAQFCSDVHFFRAAVMRACASSVLNLSKATTSLVLLVYDVLLATSLCSELGLRRSSSAEHVLYGGRERLLAQQKASAWDWLVISVERACIIAISFLPLLVLGQGLEFNLRLQNTTPSRVADVRMEAAMPLSLDARPYDWKVKSPSPFMVEGENVMFSVGDFAPYQVTHIKVYCEGVGTKAERAVTSNLDAYPLTANPSPELLALSESLPA